MKTTFLRFSLILLYYSPFIVMCSTIFHLSSLSDPNIPPLLLFPYSDKVLHILAFLGVGLTAAFGTYLRLQKAIKKTAYIEAWTLAALYGLFDEIHQMYTPNRFPSVADWIADTIGSALGVYLFFWMIVHLKQWLKHLT